METLGEVHETCDGYLVISLLDSHGRGILVPLENWESVIVSVAKTLRFLVELVGLSQSQSKPKKDISRKKSLYNAFVGRRLRELAVSDPLMPRKERMRTAVTEYGDVKHTLSRRVDVLRCRESARNVSFR